MKRVAPGARRGQILQAAAQYLLAHGLADLTLRPMAAACGTSARLLIYHFGSKDGLLRAAAELLRERIGTAGGPAAQATLAAQTAQGAPTPGSLVLAIWQEATRPDSRYALMLSFDALTRSMRTPEPWRRFTVGLHAAWRMRLDGVLPRALSAARRRQLLTLAMATLEGLLLELVRSDDLRRTSAALALFAREFERLCRLPRT